MSDTTQYPTAVGNSQGENLSVILLQISETLFQAMSICELSSVAVATASPRITHISIARNFDNVQQLLENAAKQIDILKR